MRGKSERPINKLRGWRAAVATSTLLFLIASPTQANDIFDHSNSTDTPTISPGPSAFPSASPSALPTLPPSSSPSTFPSAHPTIQPSSFPSAFPSVQPTTSVRPTATPSFSPSSSPSERPSDHPTASQKPSSQPTLSFVPTLSLHPSATPTTSLSPTIQPTPAPTRRPTVPRPPSPGGGSGGNDDDDDTPIFRIVFLMLAIVGVPILLLGRNNKNLIITSFEDPQKAYDDFRNDVLENRRLVISVPKFSFGCIKNEKPRVYALFFTTRIKAHWAPIHAYLQLCLGWITAICTFIALISPSNLAISVVGFMSILINELLTHTWYGFKRYKSDLRRGTPNFERMRFIFGVLKHGGHHVDENEQLLDAMGFPFYAIMYFFYWATRFIVNCCCRDEGKDKTGLAEYVGLLLGCISYPILFLWTQSRTGKIVSAVMHHCLAEYYEAKLFHKTPAEYLKSIVFKVILDFVGFDEDFDVNVGEALLGATGEDEEGGLDVEGGDVDPDGEELKKKEGTEQEPTDLPSDKKATETAPEDEEKPKAPESWDSDEESIK